jgi:cytochrome P450
MTHTVEPGTDPIQLMVDPQVACEPHAFYAYLRDHCPVAISSGINGEAVFLSRHEDVTWALRHPEVFSSSADAIDIGQTQPLIPLQVDPPAHAKYRRLLDPEFSPKKITALEGEARALVNRLIDRFADRGACDFHEEFATPLPSTLFLAITGLPHDDLATFLRWRDNTIRPDVAPGDVEAAAEIRRRTGEEITEYFTAAIAERRARPDDRLLSRIVHAEVEGERLSDAELLGICHLLLLGGLDTVTATLDCMVAYLARHPERRRAITADPALLDGAVEELLRWETPVQVVPRIVTQDVTLRDVAIPAGTHAVLVLGAANADPDEFPDADAVDFARARNRHLAFGGGPHRCLGSHLARFELRVGVEEFHRRIPDYDLAPGAVVRYSPGIRQAESLPIVWEPGR